MADPITNWIDARIKAAVDEAVQAARAEIVAEMQAMEKNILAQVALLPGLLGSQIQNVAIDAGTLATKVIAGVTGQLAQFPQQVIAGVLQGIPNILNPFKGQH